MFKVSDLVVLIGAHYTASILEVNDILI